MQGEVREKQETLWPYNGIVVRAFERRLGEGKLTLTPESLLFEAKNGEIIGFDISTQRLVRLKDVHTVEVAYSIQGELRSTSFRIVCTFTDGTEREELPPDDDPYRMSLFRSITGGVVARFLADHSGAKIDGLTRMTDEKFEARTNDLERNLGLFPSKREIDDGIFWDEDLQKRSLEVAELEPSIWDDPERLRLFHTGTNPTMTIDNASEKLDLLQDDWTNGRLSPNQRARAVACDYKIETRHAEMGYIDSQGGTPESWKTSAERLLGFERQLGVEILRFA